MGEKIINEESGYNTHAENSSSHVAVSSLTDMDKKSMVSRSNGVSVFPTDILMDTEDRWHQRKKFFMCAVGILICHFTLGILQEHM